MTRTRMRVGAVALLALTASLLMPIQPAQGAPASTTSSCAAGDLKPTLRDSTVNQGVGAYAALAQGKDTLVRLYLTMPSCAASTDTIVVTGGSLAVTGGSSSPISAPTPQIGDVPPTLPPYTVLTADAPANTTFVVPGSTLVSTGGAFDAVFTPTLKYKTKPTGAAEYGPELTIALAPTTAKFNKRSNGLRVLVVPMGDPTSTTPHFPPSALQAVQRGMIELARMLPVAEGVAELTSASSAGLKYSVMPGMLNLGGALGGLGYPKTSAGKYCLNGATFDRIKTKLAAYLQDWNTYNSKHQADVVLGAAWQDVVHSVGDNRGCDEGDATIGGREAWFRATDATAPSPSLRNATGAIVGMEVLHTLGASVVSTNADGGYHSKNMQADITDPDRAFDVLERKYLSSDRSVMRLSDSAWNDANVVAEPEDWEIARCRLTPGAACPYGDVLGTAAAGASIVLSGTVHVESDGSRRADLETWFTVDPDEDVEQASDTPGAPYAVVQLDSAGTVIGTTRLATRDAVTTHHDTDRSGTESQAAVIDAAVAQVGGVAAFELQYEGLTLYRRSLVDNDEPTVTVFSDPILSEPQPATGPDVVRDTTPALSADGELLAWFDGTSIRVERVDDGAAVAIITASLLSPGIPSMPAWSRSGHRLAFVKNGDVYVTEMDEDGSFSTPQPVYLTVSQTLQTPAASDPSWSPSGTELAVEIAGDIYRVDVDVLGGSQTVCVPVTDETGVARCSKLVGAAGVVERHPDWGTNGVAYDVNGTVQIVDAGSGVVSTDVVADASDPAWAGNRLFFRRSASAAGAAGIFSVPAGEPSFQPTRLTTGDDFTPAANTAGTLLAFSRPSAPSGTEDVYLGDVVDGTHVTIVVHDDTPADLRADLFVDTTETGDGALSPVIVDRDPDPGSITATSAAFTFDYDPAAGGAELVMRPRVTDGWNVTWAEYHPDGSDDAPVAAIAAPRAGSSFLQWDVVPAAGSAADDSPPLTYEWKLFYGGTSGELVKTWNTPRLDVTPPQPSKGWQKFGVYTVQLTVTDASGHSASTTVAIEILEDGDNDGIPKAKEPCTGGTDADPKNAWGDADGDGIVNVDDPQPCLSANTVSIDFEPNTLQLTSSGSPITVNMRSITASIAGIDPTTVAIVKVGNLPVHFPASAWTVNKGVGTAQFSRPDVIKFMTDNGLVGRYVPVVIEASSTSGLVHGIDANAPMTQPA